MLDLDHADVTLGQVVRIGRPYRREDDLHAFGAENSIKSVRELAVPIMDEKTQKKVTVFHVPYELSRLLRYPSAIRVCRAPSELDSPASEIEEVHV